MKKIRNQTGGFNLGTIISVLGELTCSTPHDIASHIWKGQEEKATKRFGSFNRLRSWVNNYLYSRPDLFTNLNGKGTGVFYSFTERGELLHQDVIKSNTS